MVYTKHFVIHKVKHLKQSEGYIANASKTLVNKQDTNISHLDNLFPYIINEDKTLSKQLISGYGVIDIQNASEEFFATKERVALSRGTTIMFDSEKKKMIFNKASIEKGNGRGKAVLAHHLIQSFSPEDNLTPEQIHEIGRKTILEFTGGEYEFVMATHIDKAHIHNHIIVNSTNMNTGKSMKWKIIKDKNGKDIDKTKELFEKVSDKVSSEYGAKIIEKSPKNTHKKYTMWQTDSLYKQKIKSRVDFLLEHSSSVDDFIQKANALNLSINYSKKWTTYRLLDEPQLRNTRSRNLSKRTPTKYNIEEITERLKENTVTYSVDEVVARYKEKVARKEADFDYQLTIDDWQISHKTERGYYLNIDFGYGNRGKLFIGAYKVDPLPDGQYNIYVKRNDYFYLMNEKGAERNRYMSGETLIKQLRLYNGTTPLRKEPIMRTIDELVDAVNFLAKNDIEDTRQLSTLENKLEVAFIEAEETLDQLDEKIIELNNVAKVLLTQDTEQQKELQQQLRKLLPDAPLSEFTLEDIQGEIEAITTSQSLLETKLETTRKELNKLHEIQAVQSEREEKNKENYPKL